MSTSSDAVSPSKPAKPSKRSTVDELRTGLEQLGLDSKGKKETLLKRWMKFLSRSLYIDQEAIDPLASESSPSSSETEKTAVIAPISPKKWGKQPIRSFLCFDVEATCREGREFDFPNEIIEFPVVLCRWKEGFEGKLVDETEGSRLEQIDVFHSYVRPTWRPNLGDFCTRLTGITQETVDKSPTFSDMLVELEKWMRKWDLLSEDGELQDAVWVTDGPWDLRDFIPKQLHITPPKPPTAVYPLYFLGPYLNIKAAVQTYLTEKWKREQYLLIHPNCPPSSRAQSRITTSKMVGKHDRDRERSTGPNFHLTITGQVEKLGLGEFKGQQHSGIDDATNVARVLIALGDQDVLIEANGRITQKKRWPWMGPPGEVKWEEWMSTLRPLDEKKKEDKKAESASPAVKHKDKEAGQASSEPKAVAATGQTDPEKVESSAEQQGEATGSQAETVKSWS